MFFITELDVNFRIKGPRYPLGFQSILQNLGRKVIRELSTVSGIIRDFKLKMVIDATISLQNYHKEAHNYLNWFLESKFDTINSKYI